MWNDSASTTVRAPDINALESQLLDWLGSPLGEAMLNAQRRLLEPVLDSIFGYHVLQLSYSPAINMLDDCMAGHCFTFAPAWRSGVKHTVADIESLPLASGSMDAVLIHHALDFTADSHRLVREASRVLRPGGRMIILGFNPLSLWGLSKLLRWRPQPPWNARFIAKSRLNDWLSLLDFQVERLEHGGYLPPLKHHGLLAYAPDFERWLGRWGNPTGAFYMMTAIKQRVPLIPAKPHWSKPLTAGVIGQPLPETGRVASRVTRSQRRRRADVINLPSRRRPND
jgi:SAM-dependent methyltransferase